MISLIERPALAKFQHPTKLNTGSQGLSSLPCFPNSRGAAIQTSAPTQERLVISHLATLQVLIRKFVTSHCFFGCS